MNLDELTFKSYAPDSQHEHWQTFIWYGKNCHMSQHEANTIASLLRAAVGGQWCVALVHQRSYVLYMRSNEQLGAMLLEAQLSSKGLLPRTSYNYGESLGWTFTDERLEEQN